MAQETSKWLRQAEADLKAARHSLEAGDYEWACFQAQQSAEKALKALLYDRGYTSIMTHSLKELIREAGRLEPSVKKFSREAKMLDLVYIPSRYPNGLAGDLAPTEFYEKEDAQQCLNYAELIQNAVKSIFKK